MKKRVCLILAALMLLSCLAAAHADESRSSRAILKEAARQVEDYMTGGSVDLKKASALLLAAGESGAYLRSYIDILRALDREEYTLALLGAENCCRSEAFRAFFGGLRSDVLGTADDLLAYCRGRKARAEERLSDAVHYFAQCLSYYDSARQWNECREALFSAAFAQAQAYSEQGQYREAYLLLAQLEQYGYEGGAMLAWGIKSVNPGIEEALAGEGIDLTRPETMPVELQILPEPVEPAEAPASTAAPIAEPTAAPTAEPTAVPTAEPTPAANVYRVANCKEYISLRSAPSASADVIEQVPLGEPVTYLGRASDRFMQVSWRGVTGYVHSDYLAFDDQPGRTFSAPGSVVSYDAAGAVYACSSYRQYLHSTPEDPYYDWCAFDGDTRTAWNSQQSRYGQWLAVSLFTGKTITGFGMVNGFPKTNSVWRSNASVKIVSIYADEDYLGSFNIEHTQELQMFRFDQPIECSVLRFEFDATYPGESWEDLCVAEIYLYE